MRRLWRRHLLLWLSGALLALAAPTVAAGSEVSKILERCSHGQSLSGFSPAALRRALRQLPAELSQYSECEELIRNAQLNAAGQRGGGGGGPLGGASTAPLPLPVTPAEQRVIDSAHRAQPRAIAVGGKLVVPGVVHADVGSVLNTMPAPLLAIVVFLLVGALAAAGRVLRDHVLRRRHI